MALELLWLLYRQFQLGWLQELADWNQQYLRKHGHIFIICASGKSADEMLQAIKAR